MKKYLVYCEISKVITVEAPSEENAVTAVKEALFNNSLKPPYELSPKKIEVIGEEE